MSGYGAVPAEIYDQCYRGRGRDYPTEVAALLDLVRARGGRTDSLLDVACGTGAHLALFARHCAHVEGLDLSGDMLDLARTRMPGTALHRGDMRAFRLCRTFDVLTCLFSSVGHLADPAELTAALRTMAGHLEPDGTLVVEPWWFPENFRPGYVAADLVEVGARTIARVSHSTLRGRTSRVEVHYVVAEPSGIRSFVDPHHLTLFTREEYEAAFTAAGCVPEYVPDGPHGRGLFLARPG